MRDDLARTIAGMGTPITPELVAASQALYEPRHESEPYRGVIVARDERYGTHERQRLDVFHPPAGGAPKPVLVFVHGGGFVAGDKKFAATPYYDNVGVWAVRRGFIGVTITYRLSPESPYPGAAADIGSAIRWVGEHIARYGGDPDRVVLMGQSAGSTHVATYGGRADLHPRPGGGIRAIAMLSGIYDFTIFDIAPNARGYIGSEPGAEERASPLAGLVASEIPVMFGISEFDPPAFQRQAMALADAFFAHDGRFPNVLFLPKHNHISQIAHLGAVETDDGLLSERLADFIRTHTANALTAR